MKVGGGGGGRVPVAIVPNRTLSASQSAPRLDLPWALKIPPTELASPRTVSCATTTGSVVAPCSGSMKNTAPLSVSKAWRSSQDAKSIPTVDIEPGMAAGPSSPSVRKESHCDSGITVHIAGLVGPMSVPNGWGT